MKRTPQSSITALLEGVEQAKLKKEFQQQNRKGVPLSGDGLSFVSISASNGAFTDWDENFQYGVYKIQGTLIYEKE